MRFVIYDDESLEPITVINLPLSNHWMDVRVAQHGYRWRVAVPPALPPATWREDEPVLEKVRTVDIEFEPFVRKSRRHGEQRGWFCFTRATDLAMLLNPAWLPGQRSAVDYLMEENGALTKMLMRVF